MTEPSGPGRAYIESDVVRLYQTLSQDSKYRLYVRIPERICRCLDSFNAASHRIAVKEALHSYYLFIGVVDDLLDSSQLEAGREILQQLDTSIPCFTEETKQSSIRLATEILKCHISAEIYPTALTKLEQLYQAVIGERKSDTMQAYIEQRKTVGRLTAEVSYVLISTLLERRRDDIFDLFQQVGEVGCLVDSVIDLRVDSRLGLLGFRPKLKDFLSLTIQVLRQGLTLSLKHPWLCGQFMEGMFDVLFDRLRLFSSDPRPKQLEAQRNQGTYERAV